MRLSLLALLPIVSLVACALPSKEEADGDARRALQRQSQCTILSDVAVGRPAVYFSPFDAVEAQALCALDSAKSEVLVAHYNIRTQRVLDKLVELKNRGVVVRVAVDQSNAKNEWNTGDDFLEQNGVQLVRFKPAGSQSIMHLKIAVIDRALVMTGSFNWNETASLGNDENMIAFRDPAVIDRYRNQVLELLGDRPRSVEAAKATANVEVYFAPETKLDTIIKREIDAAKTSIDVAMFTFTLKPVAEAMGRAVARGVKVRLVTEKKQEALSEADDVAQKAGVAVIKAANTVGEHSAMHQKYAVIDGKRVITGATNWTSSGTRFNEEDLLVIDSIDLAKTYQRNFADLLHVYAAIDEGAPSSEGPVLFHAVQPDTQYGDEVRVVGSHPALGNWDPRAGVPLEGDMFPDWTARAKLPAGARVEWKLVTVRANGEVIWEPGINRILSIPASGRATVISGTFGNTADTWTPHG